MEVFDYEALEPSGKIRRGSISAENARAARQELKSRNLTPIKMSATAVQAHINTQMDGRSKRQGRVKHSALTQATRQLAILVKSGTPLTEALKVAALQFEDGYLRESLLSVRAGVTEGRTMSSVMRENPKVFGPLYTSMVSAGEGAGQLGPVLERLAKDMEAAQKIRRKVLGATVYPMALSFIALAVITLLMIFIVPQIVEQFTVFGRDLPKLTNFVIAVSAWIKSYGLWLLFALVLAGLLFKHAMKYNAFRRKVDTRVLALPLFGRLNRDMNAARFARTVSGLLSSGTAMLPALETAKNTLRNLVMREAMDGVIEEVTGGRAVGAALSDTDAFPPLMIHMISSGEASEDIGEMFGVTAEYLESEFESATTIALNLLQPIIIVFLGGVVLLIVAAVFLPILQLNTLNF